MGFFGQSGQRSACRETTYEGSHTFRLLVRLEGLSRGNAGVFSHELTQMDTNRGKWGWRPSVGSKASNAAGIRRLRAAVAGDWPQDATSAIVRTASMSPVPQIRVVTPAARQAPSRSNIRSFGPQSAT